MSEQEKANIKSAYQEAADMTYIIAVSLSRAIESLENRKSHHNSRKHKTIFSKKGCRKIAGNNSYHFGF